MDVWIYLGAVIVVLFIILKKRRRTSGENDLTRQKDDAWGKVYGFLRKAY